MNRSCLKRISDTALIYTIIGSIVYETSIGEHFDHLPHHNYEPTPTYTVVSSIIGTVNTSTSTTSSSSTTTSTTTT